jgi:hypothetical protein
MSTKPKTATTRKVPAKKAPAKPRGNMTSGEIRPLIMAARKAYDVQDQHGLLDGEDFDAWRKAQCLAAVGKPGLSACHHEDFRPLLAHFQTLAGDDGSAFDNLLKSGRKTDHAATGDTQEARRQLAHSIAQVLADHAAGNRSDKPPIGVGYLVYLVRQKTRRPDLTLGSDWQAALADRCTVGQLTQLRHTLVNRIAAHQGTSTTAARNKAQRRAK